MEQKRGVGFKPDLKGIWVFLKDPASDWKPKAVLILAFVYLFWPLDLLPDFAPVIGWLDDLGFGALAGWYLVRSSDEYLKRLRK